MEVIVDGQKFVPAESNDAPRIGIAVTTHNRNDVLAKTLEHILNKSPGIPVVVIDDASKTPVDVPEGVDLVRLDKNRGIAGAKNAALAALYDKGVDHLFLFDDDAWPLVEGWWRPYIESPEPHLMAIFDKPRGATKSQVEVLYQDAQHVAYHATRGYMLYVERHVLDRVGGMDPEYGRWGWEHQSWSDRIHAAGLTTWRYADVVGSDQLIYSMDQQGEIESTATQEDRRYSTGPGLEHRMASRNSDKYIEFRDLEDVVITTMLTSQIDPQRGRPMAADASAVKALHDSLKHDGRFVVLTTGLKDVEQAIPRADIYPVVQQINPYFERWVQIYQWLRDHKEVGRVWCVDATDVTMTRNPFPEMESGKLYMGYEPVTLRDEWMVNHHPDTTIQKFMSENANLTLVNMGVVGGDREIVMRFAQKIVKMYFDDYIDFIFGWETNRVNDAQAGDMGVGNYIARTEFSDILSYGAHVVNAFKSKLGVSTAWWAHKAT